MRIYSSAERPDNTHHIGALVAAAVSFLILGVVIVAVVIPQVQSTVNQANDTLNFTVANPLRSTSGTIGQFVALSNTSATLTRDTDYIANRVNGTVRLLDSAQTNLTGSCAGAVGAGNPANRNCNYFATYFNLDPQSRSIVASVPVLMALVLLVSAATLIFSSLRKT